MFWAQTMDNGRKRWNLVNLLEMDNLDTQGLKNVKDYRQSPAKMFKITRKS